MVTDADRHVATPVEERLRELAGSVPDPELPMLTLAELGVVRGVRRTGAAAVEVELTPTYTGCPAVESMAEDIERVLRERGGMAEVRVRRVLAPAWTTDDITPEGRRKLTEAGIAPPRTTRPAGPVPVTLSARRGRTATPAGDTPAAPEPAGQAATRPSDASATASGHAGAEVTGGSGRTGPTPHGGTVSADTPAHATAPEPGPTAAVAGEPVRCPRCGSAETELLSPFSSTACKALRRCTACLEPFDHFKELT